MKVAVILIGALVAAAWAENQDFQMPDITKLNGGKMPEIPPGMKLDDLKDAFYQMPPEMKDRLNEMAQSFGMQLDDVEDALNNPPEKLKEYFDKNAANGDAPAPEGIDMSKILDSVDIGSMVDGMDLGPMGNMLKGMDIGSMMKNIDMGAMTDMMKNIDMGAMTDMMKNMDMGAMGDIMKNVDMGAMTDMMKNVDVSGLMQNMDMGAIGDMVKNVDMGSMADMMKNVDVNSMMKNMDLGAMGNMMKNVDVNSMMKNVDMGAMGDIMKNMDLGSMTNMVKDMDIGGIMKNMDVGAISGLMKNVDMGSVLKMAGMAGGPMGAMLKGMDVDAMSGIMKNMDIGKIMKMVKPLTGFVKNMDLDVLKDMMHGKMPKLGDLKRLIGLPEGAKAGELIDMAMDVLKEMGAPIDNPMGMLEFYSENLKNIPFPEGMDPAPFLNMVHGELEAMDFPSDPAEIKGFLMKKFGIDGDIKDISELKDKSVLARLVTKNVFKIMGIGEDEDPMVVLDRIHEQLLEEAEKVGAKLAKNSTKAEVLSEMDRVVSGEINKMLDIETDSANPQHIQKAIAKKLESLGVPVGDFKAMKKHLINLAMKHAMKSVVPMVMNFFMPKPKQQGPPMPPMRPPMMPQMMMMPRQPQMMMAPMNLDIEVNVEQPSQPTMPRYLQGAEHALFHPQIEQFGDEDMYHHILAVRRGLLTGEMSEEVLQELVEDLMNARLRNRVLEVRSMMLSDRLSAAERELSSMYAPEPSQPRPFAAPLRRQTRPRQTTNLLKDLIRPRVL